MRLEWGIAARPLRGQLVCGDAAIVCPFYGGAVVAAIDGLGHGASAAEAANLALRVVEARPDLAVDEQLRRCHDCLKGTRGAVMSLARFDDARATVTWTGVGNVEGALLRGDPGRVPKRHTLATPGGVVGCQLSGPRTSTLSLYPGDVLVFATDGVRPRLHDAELLFDDPGLVATRALERWSHGSDDALVVVARWLGMGA